jgi:hypothetical protein
MQNERNMHRAQGNVVEKKKERSRAKKCKHKTVKAVGGLQLQVNVLTLSRFSQKETGFSQKD